MPVQDPFLDFPAETIETTVAPALPLSAPVASSSTWRMIPIPPPKRNHAVAATSRVVSFVLGFAIASLFAWLGTLSSGVISDVSGEVAGVTPAASKVESVAPAVAPVVTAATPSPAVARTPAPTPPAPAPPIRTPAAVAKAAAPVPVPPPQRRTAPVVAGYRGALVLSSSPAGAEVLINGRTMGQTPVVLNDLPAGSRAVILRRDGYAPWSASVRVVANERVPVRATLRPIQP